MKLYPLRRREQPKKTNWREITMGGLIVFLVLWMMLIYVLTKPGNQEQKAREEKARELREKELREKAKEKREKDKKDSQEKQSQEQPQEKQSQEQPQEKLDLNKEPTGSKTQKDNDSGVGKEQQQQQKVEEKQQKQADVEQKSPERQPKEGEADNQVNQLRAAKVKEATKHAWDSFVKYAWNTDELQPISRRGKNWGPRSMGLTVVDSLDTLYLMGLNDEFKKARDWIESNYHFEGDMDISVFETTIRSLGGLLSAYELSKDTMFLERARVLGDKLLNAFNTPSGIPFGRIHLDGSHGSNPGWTGGRSILAEVGSIQLELVALSRHTGDLKYADKAMRVWEILYKQNKPNNLYPLYVDPVSGAFSGSSASLGGLGDSFYEYLIKMYIYTGGKDPRFKRMYEETVQDGVIPHLVRKTNFDSYYLASMSSLNNFEHKFEHLACFAGGMFALGAQHMAKPQQHLDVAKGITKTCHEMYNRTKTGVSPDSVNFFGNGELSFSAGNHYLLRPEAVEAFFYLWRFTGDEIYREWAWQAFLAFEKYLRTETGYSGVRDVNAAEMSYDDLQQSFWLAETMKYLYLTFVPPSVMPLDLFVFNTEAHPLAVLTPPSSSSSTTTSSSSSSFSSLSDFSSYSDWKQLFQKFQI